MSVCITLRYLSLSIDLAQSMGAGTIVMDRFERFFACSTHHYLASEGVDLLDPELGQALAYSRRRGL